MKFTFYKLCVALLFLAVPVLGVWTVVDADRWNMWFPDMVSTYGGEIDFLFNVILAMVAVTFIGTELVLVWTIFRFSKKSDGETTYTHGNHTLEIVWTAIPAVLLIIVAFSQMNAWSTVKMNFPEDGPYTKDAPMIEVTAGQFDWWVRYPDEEGNFKGADVLDVPYDIHVPVNTPVVLRLKSRDVIHSFFVPQFRLKQDAVPGMEIPVWFEATETGSYDLICAELCGWGHYKMAGKIHVLEQDEYESWLAQRREELYAND